MEDKSKQLANEINPDIQSLVNKLFVKLEATDALKGANPEAYFEKSNQILAALTACLVQRALADGLKRYKLFHHLEDGVKVGWEMFLGANPEIAAQVMVYEAEKKAKMLKLTEAEDEAEDFDGEDPVDD